MGQKTKSIDRAKPKHRLRAKTKPEKVLQPGGQEEQGKDLSPKIAQTGPGVPDLVPQHSPHMEAQNFAIFDPCIDFFFRLYPP